MPTPTPEKKPFPADALDRLKVAVKAIDEMTTEERCAAFEWMKSKYRAEWPYQ